MGDQSSKVSPAATPKGGKETAANTTLDATKLNTLEDGQDGENLSDDGSKLSSLVRTPPPLEPVIDLPPIEPT